MPVGPEPKEHELMTEPGMAPAADPVSVSTEDELLVAVLALLGDSYDRAVERRTGLSKTTVNDLRNGRRRLTAKTLTLIVEAYDPHRRDAWLAARRRVAQRAGRTDPNATPRVGDDAAEAPRRLASEGPGPHSQAPAAHTPTPADAVVSASAAPATPSGAFVDSPGSVRPRAAAGNDLDVAGRGTGAARPAGPGHRRTAPWRTVSLTVSAALVASALAALVTFLAVRGEDAGPARLDAADTSAAQGPLAAPGLPPDDGPPGAGRQRTGPGGPGVAGPVGGPGPPRADMSPTGSAAAVPRGCDLRPAQTPALVVLQPGADVAGIRLTEVRYTYFPAWHPSLAVGGRLSGPVPPGWRLLLAGWADPATTDATVARNAGNGRYYPGDEQVPTDQNCFAVPPYSLGYGGYEGITTRIYALLVNGAKTLPFLRSAGQLGGLAATDLDQWGIRILGYAVIPPRAG